MKRLSLPCLVLAGACAAPAAEPGTMTPSPAAAVSPTLSPDARSRLVAEHAAVASANGLASEAGVAMLRAGGNAVDAAVATAFAIGVVEPQMSGLGGGGAALVWLEGEDAPHYLDFYAAQHAPTFVGHTGGREGDDDLRVVAIPGEVEGLLTLHERFGHLSRAEVMAPAIRLAEEGFPVGQMLAQFIAGDSAELHLDPDAAALFWPGGEPLRPGETLRNPVLARTLRRIAADGAAGFQTGPVAEAVVAELNAGGHPATVADLAGYEPQWEAPLCTTYKGRAVLSAPPPQTGMQVLETLNLLEPFDLSSIGLPTTSPRAFDLIVSALRIGQADADANDDPRWADVPARGVVSAGYADARRDWLARAPVPDSIPTGDASRFAGAPPPAGCAWTPATQQETDGGPASRARRESRPASASASAIAGEAGETTHISVVDADGNAVALTQTNSTLWGSGAWVSGFFLNDSGYLFRDEDGPTAGPEWRTRNSTISPTIALLDGDVDVVIGAPGGGRIPTEIAQVLVYLLDYRMDPMAAVRMPRIYPSESDREVELEHGFRPALLGDVRTLGYDPVPESFGYARLYLIARAGDAWIAISDPRHDGEPRGY